MASSSLATFVRFAWDVIEPSTPLIWNWHLDVICDHVQALLEGKLGKRNLLINVPPGSMKSTIVSVCAPAWKWLHDPGWRGIFAAGSEPLALRDSIKCRALIDSDWYQQTFKPRWGFAKDQNAKGNFKNTATGSRLSTTAGSHVTGERGHGIFIDDPLDAANAFSAAEREKVLTWYTQAFANRINDPQTGTRCLIMQRLHEEDLAGYILAHEREQWDVVVIRQEYEVPQPRDPDSRPTTLPWCDPREEEGELFFPARFPAETILMERARLGISGYAGQHQQRPSAKEGEIFKRGFVRMLDASVPAPKFKRVVMSWDTAFKEKTQSDYSAGIVAGEAEDGIYLLDCIRQRMSYPALKQKARTWAERYRPNALLIEDKASGQSLIQELQQETALPVVPIKVDTDKVSRAWAVVPTWEARRVAIPAGAPWADELLEELYTFPRAAHDDQVDAFTQLLNYLCIIPPNPWASLIESDLRERANAAK